MKEDKEENMIENIHWLGHASFKITNDKKIFIDPYQLKKKETADIILITHSHYDHCSRDDVDMLKGPQTVIITTKDSASQLSGNIKIINPGETITEAGIQIEAVPAYNMRKAFHPKDFGNGYVIQIGTQTIYHAGDTDFIPEMEKLREFEIDIALLPVGGTFTMDVREAVKAIKAIQPKKVWPMHYGTLPQTTADIDQLKQLIKNYELNVEVITE